MGIREIIGFVLGQWLAQGAQCYAQARALESTTKSGQAGWNAVANASGNLIQAAVIGLDAANKEFAAYQAYQQQVIESEKAAAAALQMIQPVTCSSGPTPPPGGHGPGTSAADHTFTTPPKGK